MEEMSIYTNVVPGFWNEGEPPGKYRTAKLILLTEGGILITGRWGAGMKAWALLPKFKLKTQEPANVLF